MKLAILFSVAASAAAFSQVRTYLVCTSPVGVLKLTVIEPSPIKDVEI
jgi:hypothetical protein